MSCKDRLDAYLRENRIPFQFQHHPAAFTAQEVAASEHVPGRLVAKTFMAMADGKLVMAVVPAPAKVDLDKLQRATGAEDVRVATEAEFGPAFPDCDVGAMPALGNIYNVPVYLDQALTHNDTMVTQAGTHTDTISLKYADYARLVQPKVADLSR
ncbi:MAG: YbaK/EbsC family protein [Gemmatimonadetes bacterium]|nr:YbaK/EbsC family protein [Gemmatimonadota bacterium]